MADPTPNKYKKLLNLTGAKFCRIDHDDTIIAVVYRILQSSKPPLILKVCTQEEDYHRELYFLRLFTNSLPVPSIIDTVDPTSESAGAILLECLDGHLLQPNDWTDRLAYEVGSVLARIHLNRTNGYGGLTNPQSLCTNNLKNWEFGKAGARSLIQQSSAEAAQLEQVKRCRRNQNPRCPARPKTNSSGCLCISLSAKSYFERKFNEELDECTPHLPQKLIEQCQHYLASHRYLLDTVDGPCIIHRDFRPGNMIVCNGKLQGIIDWAGARSGFAEQDFCPMEHRQWPSQPEHKKALLKGYASIRPVPNYQQIMPLLRLGRALAVIGFCVKTDTWKEKNSKLYQYNRRFLESFIFKS